jgi:hypothetical protein
MPEVGEIVAALQQAAKGLGKAQSAAARLAAGVQRVQSRAAGTGFRHMADQLGQVRQRVNRIRQMQSAVATTVAPIGEAVQRVSTDGLSPADVVSTLTLAAQQIGTASTSTAAVLHEVDRLKTDIAAALKGGQPGPLIALADEVRHALVHAAGSLDTAKQRTDQAVSEARQMGNFPPGMAAAPE